MKVIRNFRRSLIVIFVCSIGLFTSVSTSGVDHKANDNCLVNTPQVLVDEAQMSEFMPGVIYESSAQICTSRMGCRCRHRRGDTDTLKKHTPEENPYDDQNSWNPHLDIKCTKCNSDWYCPVFKRYRG